jgi:YebC/PmpR family DNA-binding regulatory protein
MAGHSKWANIQHRKSAQDKKRSKHFSKFSKAIMIAAREGGGDPEKNLKLRYAVDKAKAGNMPLATIERAIKKATGELGDVQFHEILYEGYGPGGVAILAEVVTDNRNRTAPELRHMFGKHGGNLADPGAVTFMFDRKGLIGVPTSAGDEDEVFMVALEAGAEDVEAGEDQYGIVTAPQEFEKVKAALKEQGWEFSTAELAWVPQTSITPSEADLAKVEALLSDLDDHDDVNAVHSNFAPAEA